MLVFVCVLVQKTLEFKGSTSVQNGNSVCSSLPIPQYEGMHTLPMNILFLTYTVCHKSEHSYFIVFSSDNTDTWIQRKVVVVYNCLLKR